MNIKELVNDFRLGCAEAEKSGGRVALREAIDKRNKITKAAFKKNAKECKDFSIQELFVECFGWNELIRCRSARDLDFTELREAAGAVSTAAFQNISGQIVYGMTLDAYESPEFVVTKTIPVRQSNISGYEKIAGINRIGDENQEVKEGDDYPLAGVSEDWILFDEPKKKGMRIPLTKEAIFYDKTGLLVQRCQEVGNWFGANLEKSAVDCVIDENVTSHRYNWRGTVIATYGDNSGSHDWDNLAATNGLVDWTDIQAAYQLMRLILDPFTGEPTMIVPTHLYVPTGLEWVARQILTAATIMRTTPGFATTGDPTKTEATNPVLSLGLTLVTTPYMEFRQGTDTSWYMANPNKAWVRNEHWPMDVQQAPANSEDEFKRDIAMQFKVSGKMKFETPQPRAAVKSTA